MHISALASRHVYRCYEKVGARVNGSGKQVNYFLILCLPLAVNPMYKYPQLLSAKWHLFLLNLSKWHLIKSSGSHGVAKSTACLLVCIPYLTETHW